MNLRRLIDIAAPLPAKAVPDAGTGPAFIEVRHLLRAEADRGGIP